MKSKNEKSHIFIGEKISKKSPPEIKRAFWLEITQKVRKMFWIRKNNRNVPLFVTDVLCKAPL